MKPMLLAGLAAAALSSVAPYAPASAAPFAAPRNGFGQPDLSGNWTNATLTPQARPAKFADRLAMSPQEVKAAEGAADEEIARGNARSDPNAPIVKDGSVGGYNRGFLDPGTRVMRVRGEPRTSLFTTPDGQVPDPLPGVRLSGRMARPAQIGSSYTIDKFGSVGGTPQSDLAGFNRRYDNPEDLSLGEQCLTSFGRNGPPPMFPNGFYNNNYQIVQNRDEVAIEIEMVHDVRHVRLGAKTHLPDSVRPWFGDSIGHWEGPTLVVETTNLPKTQAYFGAWKTLKVTERFTRVAKDRLFYQFTVEDPSVWAKRWGGEYEFAPLVGQLYEYACHEGNYAIVGILGGTRAADKAAAEGAPTNR
jgi:hypothetical protein